MAETTNIAWADATFNPWIGCTNISPGCDACYAEALDKIRFSKTLGGATKNIPISHWGPGAPRVRTVASTWLKPLQWDKKAAASGKPMRVFCASLADVFDNEVPVAWRMELFDLIRRTPNLTWLVLTKRIGNAEDMLPGGWYGDPAAPYCGPFPNVWLGATVVNQDEADRDVPKLLRVPAAVRFLSCEPLLGPINLRQAHLASERLPRVDWVICGGESGTHARTFDLAWARALLGECRAADVPFFMKQTGALARVDADHVLRAQDRAGAEPSRWPEDLRVREFPRC